MISSRLCLGQPPSPAALLETGPSPPLPPHPLPPQDNSQQRLPLPPHRITPIIPSRVCCSTTLMQTRVAHAGFGWHCSAGPSGEQRWRGSTAVRPCRRRPQVCSCACRVHAPHGGWSCTDCHACHWACICAMLTRGLLVLTRVSNCDSKLQLVVTEHCRSAVAAQQWQLSPPCVCA